MPLYEYIAEKDSCDYCRDGFEIVQKISEPALTQCPKCLHPCRKVLSTFAVNRSVKDLLSPKNIEKHGFTQYRKTSSGYEKTAGKGPNLLPKE